jgi:hypothetical protein
MACVAALVVMSGPVWADLEVMDSSVPGIERGAILADDAVLKVPAGAKLELLKKPANTTHTVKGPHEGTLEAYLNPCPWWRAVLGQCKPDDSEIGKGGTKGIAPIGGGTRGAIPPKD